jgi:hypothetical protein
MLLLKGIKDESGKIVTKFLDPDDNNSFLGYQVIEHAKTEALEMV